MKRILLATAIAATLISGPSAAQTAAKVTLVYDHVLPNVPGKSMRGVLVE